jgi:hypothetical protein
MVEIVDPLIPSTSTDIGQHLHPHMECDQPTPPIWVVDSLISHDILDFEFPSEEAILEVMASIEIPKDEVIIKTILLYFGTMRVNMMSLDLDWGHLVGNPINLLVLTLFFLGLSFSKLSTEFFTTPSIEDSHFILPSCLDGSHQGDSLAHKTTHDEYLWPCKIHFYVAWPQHGVPYDANIGS